MFLSDTEMEDLSPDHTNEDEEVAGRNHEKYETNLISDKIFVESKRYTPF